MKMKIECQNLSEKEKQLIKRNDNYRYNIEKYKRIELVEKYARNMGMVYITPKDFKVLKIAK